MQTEKDYLKEGQSLYKHRPLSTLHRCNRSHKNIQPCNVAALMIRWFYYKFPNSRAIKAEKHIVYHI